MRRISFYSPASEISAFILPAHKRAGDGNRHHRIIRKECILREQVESLRLAIAEFKPRTNDVSENRATHNASLTVNADFFGNLLIAAKLPIGVAAELHEHIRAVLFKPIAHRRDRKPRGRLKRIMVNADADAAKRD